ncbi:MAG: hypothetical protein GF329_01345 [Candidatus Lokiarchaeota archaeon]|nr:hypothetical protein [Candidatus Lokiarchaeota archaeon]
MVNMFHSFINVLVCPYFFRLVTTVIGVILLVFTLFRFLISILTSPSDPTAILDMFLSIYPILIITMAIIGSVGIASGIIQYYLLDHGIEYIGKKTNTNMNNHRKAKRFYIFSPIVSGLSIIYFIFSYLNIFFSLSYPFNITFNIINISVDIIYISFTILGLIGVVYYGIFVYKIGKNTFQNVLVAGGILLIIYPFIGAILIYIGLKRLSKM